MELLAAQKLLKRRFGATALSPFARAHAGSSLGDLSDRLHVWRSVIFRQAYGQPTSELSRRRTTYANAPIPSRTSDEDARTTRGIGIDEGAEVSTTGTSFGGGSWITLGVLSVLGGRASPRSRAAS